MPDPSGTNGGKKTNLSFSGSIASFASINIPIFPASRNFAWNPGRTSKGGPSGAGIPNRTIIFTTLSPLGGANVTISIASPAVVTWTAHGRSAGDAFVFQTTGALPTGVTANTLYFVLATGLTANTFQFSSSAGGAAINTSGTQSGTQSVTVDDTNQIQVAINNCTLGQVVALNAGTYLGVNGYILLNKGITLRGAGAGLTIIKKVDGCKLESYFTATIDNGAGAAGTTLTVTGVGSLGSTPLYNGALIFKANPANNTVVANNTSITALGTGTGGTGTYTVNNSQLVTSQVLNSGLSNGSNSTTQIVLGFSRDLGQFGGRDSSANSVALTADTVLGSTSIFVADTTKFAVGDFVLLDQNINDNVWVPDTLPGDDIAAVLTASISGTTMTVTAISGGAHGAGAIKAYMLLTGAGIPPNTFVLAFGTNGTTGVGGAGGTTYALNANLGTIASQTINVGYSVFASPDYRLVHRKARPTKNSLENYGTQIITGSVAGNVMTVTALGASEPGGIGVAPTLTVTPPGNLPSPNDTQITAAFSGSFTGKIDNGAGSAGTTLTVQSSVTGDPIAVGMTLSGTGITGSTTVLSGSGTSWTVNNSQLVASETMTAAFTGGTGSYHLANSSLAGTSGAYELNAWPTTPNTAGDFFSRLGRMWCEIKEITAIDSIAKKITFSSPVSFDYHVSNVAQLTFADDGTGTKIQFIQDAGVEGITFNGGDQNAITFKLAAYCWAKNVEIGTYNGHALSFASAFRCEFRHSYIHHAAFASPGGGSYNWAFEGGSSECLIEDCISILADKNSTSLDAGCGNVVGYCYLDQQYIHYTGTASGGCWVEIGANASHVLGTHHFLFEGNHASNGDSDIQHGGSGHTIHFRNNYTTFRQPFLNLGNGITYNDLTMTSGPQRAAGAQYGNNTMTFIGNILGLQGQMGGRGYVYDDPNAGDPSIWLMGWDTNENGQRVSDPKVRATMIRDGNWDWLQGVQSWHTTPATFIMPQSLYLPGKPAFFGSTTWPPYDPSNGSTNVIPAKARYDNGTPNGP